MYFSVFDFTIQYQIRKKNFANASLKRPDYRSDESEISKFFFIIQNKIAAVQYVGIRFAKLWRRCRICMFKIQVLYDEVQLNSENEDQVSLPNF